MPGATADDAVLAIRNAVQSAGEDFVFIGTPANIEQIEWFGQYLLRWRWPASYLDVLRKHDGVPFVTPILFAFIESVRVLLIFGDRWYRSTRRWPVGGDGCGNYWVLSFDEQRADGECPIGFIEAEHGPTSEGRFAGENYADFIVSC